ncbi:MAG TPA: ABC transporter, partial [Cupriavidus sp.]|nr:ABC transporter [Cupriavidus sp.]
PTNHLDLDTREALTMALAQFEGTLILVSHDRHLLRATSDQFMLVAEGTIRPFDGDLDDYRDWLLQQAAAKRNAATAAHAAEAAPVVNRKDQRRAEADERQRLSVLRKPLTKELEKVEKRMSVLQADKTTIDAFMSDASSYDDANKTKLKDMLKRQGEVTGELEQLEERWLELQEQIEQIA